MKQLPVQTAPQRMTRRYERRPQSLQPRFMLDSRRRAEMEKLPRGWNRSHPKVRRDCLAGGCNAKRPCPWVSCKYNLSIDVCEVNGTGECRPIKITFPSAEDPTMPDFHAVPINCALDLIDSTPDGVSLDVIGWATNRTVERVRQILHQGAYQMRIVMRWQALYAPGPRRADAQSTALAGAHRRETEGARDTTPPPRNHSNSERTEETHGR